MAFTDIDVFPYDVVYNKYDRPQYRQCQMENRIPAPYGTYGYERVRCGGSADVIVKRTSVESGNTYEDAMCPSHAQPWIEALKKEGK